MPTPLHNTIGGPYNKVKIDDGEAGEATTIGRSRVVFPEMICKGRCGVHAPAQAVGSQVLPAIQGLPR